MKYFLWLLLIPYGYATSFKQLYELPPGVGDGTWFSTVNLSLWEQKWDSPLPEWMFDRINQELLPFREKKISQEALDKTFAQILPIIRIDARYRFIKGEIYRLGSDPYGFGDYYFRGLAAFANVVGVPDLPSVDFIFHQGDGIPIAPPFFHPSDFWVMEDFQDQAPILCYARGKEAKYLVSVPDRFTIPGPTWPRLIPAILQGSQAIPWDNKIKAACWRGSPTDFCRHSIPAYSLEEIEKEYSSRPRYILSALSQKRPDLIDAGFNSIHIPAPFLVNFLRPLMKPSLSPAAHLNYAYLPVLDGYTSTFPGYIWRLLSNSVVFKQETTQSQWFYDALKPYVHYIPIKEHMEDLVETILWAREHDTECQQISENARKFVLENLMIEDMYLYQLLVFLEYAKCQDFNLEHLLQETRENPEWVRIR